MPVARFSSASDSFSVGAHPCQTSRWFKLAEQSGLGVPRCNERKGTNLSAVDPDTNRVVRLFNPLNRSEHSILTARIFNPLPFLAPPIRQVRQIRRGFHPQPLRNPSQCHRGLPPQPRGNPHLLPVALAPPLQLFPLPTQRLQILPRQALGLGLRRLPNLLSGLSGLSGWLV